MGQTPKAPPPELPSGVVALIPMRNLVLFPHVLAPISVGRPKSIASADSCCASS